MALELRLKSGSNTGKNLKTRCYSVSGASFHVRLAATIGF